MMRDVLLLLVVLVIFSGMGWLMIESLAWARRRGQVQASVGNALQELERIVTKPAVKHVVETETKLPREDDRGGE